MSGLRERPGFPQGWQPSPNAAQEPMMRPLAPAPEPAFFHFDFARAWQLHRKLAVSIFLCGAVLALAYTVKTWKHYVAESRVYVQPAPARLLDNGANGRWPADANSYETYIQQQIQDVTRPDVLLGALRRLPPASFRKDNETEQAAVERLGRAVEVARIGNSYAVSITAKAHSAEMAAAISNAVADSYIESATHELRAGDVQRIQLLREERDRVAKELAADRAEQGDLNRELGVAAVGTSTPDPYDEQISALRGELVKARTENDEAAARLTSMVGGKSAAIDAEADVLVASDPGLVSLKTSLNQRRSALISQMANLTPSHPLYKQDTAELAQINASLDTMTKDLRAKAAAQLEQRLKTDLERTSSVEARLNAQLAQLTSAAGTASPRLQRSNDLAADIQRLQTRYAAVDEQFRNLVLENNAPGAVYLSNAAVPPLGPDHTKTFRIAAVLLVAGLIFGWAAALAAHNLDPRIYIGADVERVLGFAPMAQLPDFHEVGTGVAEEYMLRLAAAVEHAHQDGALKSCIFTGIAAGTGTSTVANRVRNMLEGMGRQTVLLDATGSTAAWPAEAGTELVHVPRGSRSTALLQQMTEGAAEKTIVVSDTAPLLVSGETEYMARFVDAVIVVIESGVTTKAQLREAARTLQRLHVAVAGFVLNRVALEKADPAFLSSLRAVEEHIEWQTRVLTRRDAQSGAEWANEPPRAATELAKVAETVAPRLAQVSEPMQRAGAQEPEQAPSAGQAAAEEISSVPKEQAQVERAATPVEPMQTAVHDEYREEADGSADRTMPKKAEEQEVQPRPLPGLGVRRSEGFKAPLAPPIYRSPEPMPAAPPPPPTVSAAKPSSRPSDPATRAKEDDYDAASRLGGLRSLLASLGLDGLSRASEAQPEPGPERVQERTVYPEGSSTAEPGLRVSPANVVTTPPEILPPRPAPEKPEREEGPARSAAETVRQDTPQPAIPAEDVTTLPAKRGQYRTRS